LDRAFDRLVMLGEWPVSERRQRREDASDAFGIHDEGAHVILRRGVRFEVWDVDAEPLLLRLAPPDLPARGVPRLGPGLTRCAIVEYAPVRGPRPRPVRIHAEPRRILRAPALHHRAGLRPRPAVDPVAARCGAVVF